MSYSRTVRPPWPSCVHFSLLVNPPQSVAGGNFAELLYNFFGGSGGKESPISIPQPNPTYQQRAIGRGRVCVTAAAAAAAARRTFPPLMSRARASWGGWRGCGTFKRESHATSLQFSAAGLADEVSDWVTTIGTERGGASGRRRSCLLAIIALVAFFGYPSSWLSLSRPERPREKFSTAQQDFSLINRKKKEIAAVSL